MSQARLIVVAGLPGSGKTTLAHQLEQTYAAVRLSADDWMESLGSTCTVNRRVLLWASALIYSGSFFVAYLRGPNLERMDR